LNSRDWKGLDDEALDPAWAAIEKAGFKLVVFIHLNVSLTNNCYSIPGRSAPYPVGASTSVLKIDYRDAEGIAPSQTFLTKRMHFVTFIKKY